METLYAISTAIIFIGGIASIIKLKKIKKQSSLPIPRYTIRQLTTHLEQTYYKNIIFDLSGVLFSISKTAFLKEIGYFNFAWYCLSHRKNPKKLFVTFFDVLDRIAPTPHEQYSYKEDKLPLLVYQLGIGEITTQEIINRCHEAINSSAMAKCFASNQEKNIIKDTVHIFFNPQFLVEKIFKPINNMATLLKKFATRRDPKGNRLHRIFLLSNLDNETFPLLQEKYPHIFNNFDGMIISAQVKHMKPDLAIYQELLNRYHLNPQECFFIDDQADNIVAANQLGIAGSQFID